MKTTRNLKATANAAPASVEKDPMPAWAIGSDTEDIYVDAKMARALASLLKDLATEARREDPEEREERDLQIQELADSVSSWTEMVVEKVETRLKLEALPAAA